MMQNRRMIVTVKSSTMVSPAAETPHDGLFNSNLDLMMPSIHVRMIYFYRADGSRNFFDIKTLKESLGQVLVAFYPMAGRLKIGESGRIEINCTGEGVLFVEAVTGAKLDDLGDFAPIAEFVQLVPLVEQKQGVSSFPLLAVQVTYFECGGVCLGVSMHHYVGDACALFHFTNSWSEMARGMEAITTTPCLDRALLRARHPPRPSFKHAEYLPQPEWKRRSTGNLKNAPPAAAIFKLTESQVARLKDNAKTKGNNGNNNYDVNYGVTEIVTAHLWRCVTKARGLDLDQETMLYIPVNGRNRLWPPLPSGYFGNVIFCSAPTVRSRDLSNSTHYGLSRIHDALAQMDDEYFRSAIDLLSMMPDLPSLFVKAQPLFSFPSVVVNSFLSLPVHEADFGWGKPIFLGPASIPIDGLIFILPSSSMDKNISVAVGLQPQHLVEFGKLIHDI